MKLYVGNMNYSMTEKEIEEDFAENGSVASAVIIRDRETNRSKGFGFVEIEDNSEAEAAIEALNGAVVNQRTLVVNQARPPKSREGGGGGFQQRRRY